MKRIFACFLALLCLTVFCGSRVFAAGDIVDVARHGVAVVDVGVQVDDFWDEHGSGSGFFVGEKNKPVQYLITNHHVVADFLENGAGELTEFMTTSGEIVLGRAKVRVYFDKEDYVEAYVMDADPIRDIALLRLAEPTDKRAALTLCIPTNDMVGDTVYAVGYPGIADSLIKESVTSWGEADATVSTGVVGRISTVSGTGVSQILTDADIRHGNSGGPLMNDRAQVLGINTYSVSRNDEQVNYAVNISEALPMLDMHNVPYTVGGGVSWVVWLLAGLLAAAVIAVILLAVLRSRRRCARKLPAQQTDPAMQSAPRPAAADPAESLDSGFRLQGVAGALEGKRFAIPRSGQLTLGRDPARCTVTLPADTAGVSGLHCAIWLEESGICLKDLGSTHGTFVSPGSRLAGGQAVLVRPGEVFWLGSQAQSFVIAERRQG